MNHTSWGLVFCTSSITMFMLLDCPLNELAHCFFVFLEDLHIIYVPQQCNFVSICNFFGTQMSNGITLKPNFSKSFLNFLLNDKDETIIPCNAFTSRISKHNTEAPFSFVKNGPHVFILTLKKSNKHVLKLGSKWGLKPSCLANYSTYRMTSWVSGVTFFYKMSSDGACWF